MGISARTIGALAACAGLLAAATLAGCSKPAPVHQIAARAPAEKRPNVLVILVDHLGPEFDVYGDKLPATPNLDRLAREGVTFTRAYAASGADDASEAAMLTGVFPHAIGMVHEWVDGQVWTVAPPVEIQAAPQTLRAAGYDTFHIGARSDAFGAASILWTQQVSSDLSPGQSPWPPGVLTQPFYGEIDLSTLDTPDEDKAVAHSWLSSLMSVGQQRAREPAVPHVDPQAVSVPAYLPDSHSMRVALARRYETIERTDAQVGAILAALDKAGLSATTDIILTARSGPPVPRGERTLYDSGVHVPLILRRADHAGAGSVRKDLVSGVDLAPSILGLAGLKPFAWMQGRDRFGGGADPAHFVYSTQGWIGNAMERAFSVRDGRFLYIHNLAFDAPIFALSRRSPAQLAFRAAMLHRPGLTQPPRLTPGQSRILSKERPEDELYDLDKDPEQMTNLAEDPHHSGDLERLSTALNAFVASAPDYSSWETHELQDLFRPRGVTPTAAAPTGVVAGGRLTLDSATPGAVILWRLGETAPWKIYTGPIPAADGLQAKAARYGYLDSLPKSFNARP
jgi:arylsulfatase A-like enzyme